jgi:hypothetical protein
MSSIADSRKRRGRPKTGIGSAIGLRLYPELDGRLEAWIEAQPEPRPSRPEAIRQLIEHGIKATTRAEAGIMITGEQVKEARKLLGWTLLDLGYRARVSDATIMTFEAAQRPIRPEKIQAIRRTLEQAAVEFIAENGGGLGVRLRKPP